jgi:hypothetical protein
MPVNLIGNVNRTIVEKLYHEYQDQEKEQGMACLYSAMF